MGSLGLKPAVVLLALTLSPAAVPADTPAYVIGPPDVLRLEVAGLPGMGHQSVQGEHLVRPDGTISLGSYGSVLVSGLSVEQARSALTKYLAQYAAKAALDVR